MSLHNDYDQFNRPICKVRCSLITETEQHFTERGRMPRSHRSIFILRGIQMAKDVKLKDKGTMYYRSTKNWGLYFFVPRNSAKKNYHWDIQEQMDRTAHTVVEDYVPKRRTVKLLPKTWAEAK